MTGNAKFGSRLLKTNSISRHCKYFARVSTLKGFLLFGWGVPGVAWRGVALLAACCEDPHSHTITRHRRCHKLDAYLIWIGVSGWRLLAENQLSGNFYHLGVFPPPAPVPAPNSNSIWFTNFLSCIPVCIFADKRKRYVHIVLPKNTWGLGLGLGLGLRPRLELQRNLMSFQFGFLVCVLFFVFVFVCCSRLVDFYLTVRVHKKYLRLQR